MAQTHEDNGADAVVVVVEQDVAPAAPTVSEQAEQVVRAASVLSFRGAELAAARRQPAVRRALEGMVAVSVLVLALLTAFAFGNWAAASALSNVLPSWAAALVLAGAWIGVAALVGALLMRDAGVTRNWRRALAPASVENIEERERALEDAQQTLRDTVDRLGEAIALAAEQRIAAAVLPLAGGMVEVGEEMVEATDEVIEAADEITDAIEEKLPGGLLVNRAVDFALVPGRVCIKLARTVLTVGSPSA